MPAQKDATGCPSVGTRAHVMQEDLGLSIIVEILIEFVYHTPALFGSVDFVEDERSFFLLSVHNEIPKVIANYDEGKGKFFTYFVSYVRLIAKGCRRTMAKNRARSASVEYCYHLDHPMVFDIREDEQEYSVAPRSRPFKKSVEKMLLVLALKNAYLITERQIVFISGITGFDRARLSDLVERIKTSLGAKAESRKKIVESRNQAFVHKTKCRIELERMTQGTPQYLAVQRQLKFHSNLLDRKNEALKTRLRLMPSNRYIGELLGIPVRSVSRILDDAVKKAGQNRGGLLTRDYVI